MTFKKKKDQGVPPYKLFMVTYKVRLHTYLDI